MKLIAGRHLIHSTRAKKRDSKQLNDRTSEDNMSSAVGHERRCAGHRQLFLVFSWIALSTIVAVSEANPQREGVAERKREQARLKDQQMLRSKSTEKLGGAELENICDIDQSSLLVYCLCDSLTLQDAGEAKCTVFNVSDQNDSIWEAFRTQASLTELQLNVNEDGRLYFLPSAVLRSLPHLLSLQVREATIDTLLPHTFIDVPKLEELALNRNQIRHIRPFAFQGLNKTVELELSNNMLSSLERGVFSGLDNLQKLHLDGNNISLVEDSVFQNMGKLEELDLSGNQIAVLAGETLMGLRKLKKLNFRGNQMTILGDHTFAYVQNLQRLDLSSNQLQVIRHQALSSLRRLDNLNLAHNKLTVLDKTSMVPIWPNLLDKPFKFSLEDNPLQCHCDMLWIYRDLKQSSSSENLNLESLTCQAQEGESKNLLSLLATLDCQTTTASPATVKPSRVSTTVPYLVQDEPATKKQTLLINDSSASLQLSSPAESKDIRPQEPASSATVPSEQLAGQSSAANFGVFPFVTLSVSLVLIAVM